MRENWLEKHSTRWNLVISVMALKFINVKEGVFKLKMTNQLMDKWKSAVDRPVYLNDRHQSTICRFERPGLFNFLNLPTIPKNIEEIKIIRCWIEKISRCYFYHLDFNSIFDPEIIQLIFDDEEVDKIKFNCQSCRCLLIRDETVFYLDRLVINESIWFCRDSSGNLKQDLIDILIKFLLKIPKVIIHNSLQSALCKPILNHIETAKDYSNIVSNRIWSLCLQLSFTLSERAELIEKSQKEDFNFTSYKYNLINMHNPNVKFSIFFLPSLAKSL
ncbi:hypothetical protein ACQ4LE_002036 [Meloidogyne hapla]